MLHDSASHGKMCFLIVNQSVNQPLYETLLLHSFIPRIASFTSRCYYSVRSSVLQHVSFIRGPYLAARAL